MLLLVPGEGAATCQVCGTSFTEGDRVVIYALRPASTPHYQIGHVICGADEHRLIQECTLGVQEAFIAGRMGTCSDVATQSTWPVVLGLKTIAVSAAATKSLRWNPGATSATADTDTTEEITNQNSSREIEWAGEQATTTRGHSNSHTATDTERATDDHAHTQNHPADSHDPSGEAQR